ncbi:transketolase [Actinotignum sanguinis]|uniref:Transketolase n=7 Tax=Actinomycetaceae TaxID=2049 RepID=A0ABZ0RFD1_9ACTO|nr:MULTISPECIES: transketolase [Actinotignum]WPJ89639.1 transketolase [Schaalia turicensis]MDE1553219.1 transketolase [Actinotignum sanguinis]MDE1566135.1 transketolase [Actinotignum sanguinis]MDE1577098.1 transketolase [Actinotignum sanguinis]MDE1642971.1 transketolase [Actinotignum sanguinis]
MAKLEWSQLDQRAVDTTRLLAADAVQKTGNGHPGTAMSLAPAAYLLYQRVMNHDPADSAWVGRDRFILSAGHSSLTQYNQLLLAGYGLELDDIKALRTLHSKTPGHPEYGYTNGVEMTTGPLGQGLASAVGFAMASRRAHGLFDRDTPLGESVFDHFVYVIAGDGCLQEGVTSEACSLAGTQELGNLILIYDDNRISIEDNTSIAFSEDVLARYEAYGWHTQHVNWIKEDGSYQEDVQALYDAILAAQQVTDKPSIIKLSTIIAWPAPTKQNTGASHGSALGVEEIRATKEILGFDPDIDFPLEDDVLAHTRKNAAARAAAARKDWDARFEAWRASHPEEAALYDRIRAKKFPEGWEKKLPSWEPDPKGIATRAASGVVLNALAPVLPELWGGSADLAGSNNTTMKGEPSFLPAHRSSTMFSGDIYGRTLHFGIREFAMGAIINGITLDGLTRAYGGTFFVFSDYMRGAARLAAIMNIPSIFVWTHDSVGVGEDGPTHQPIEHLWAYRAIPRLNIVRPADANETAAAWRGALEKVDGGPTGLILTRQGVPVLEGTSTEGVLKGGYVLADSPTGTVDVQLLATGSEVQLAVAAQQSLAEQGVGARVISLPCLEWFEAQDQAYRDAVILPNVKARVSVEAGATFGWAGYVGDAGRSVGINTYGESGPGGALMKEYGMTAEHVVSAALESIEAARA